MKRRGFTLPEVLITMTVGTILLAGGYFMITMASDTYRHISGHEDGALQMKKASRQMQVDLLGSFSAATGVHAAPGPGGTNGDAVVLLSSRKEDRADGATCVTATGAPYWQRNIIYYPAIPTGDTCAGGVNGDGYEDMCPHKVVIRKVVDSGPPTRPAEDGGIPAADKEELLTDVSTYLTRPSGLGTTAMLSEPGVTSAEIVATNLLTIRAEKDPDPNAPGEVKVTFQAFNEDVGSRTTAIGTTNLGNHAKTQTHVLSVFPRNTQ